MPVETRAERENNSISIGTRVRARSEANAADATMNEGQYPARRRRRRRTSDIAGPYQARGYRTRHLTAGDRNQEYLQEGVPEVARE